MNTTEKETMVAAAIPNGAKLNPYDSGLKMARAIRDGTVTSRQLVEMYIDRIERLDTEKISAVVVRDFDCARSRADEADEKLRLWKKDGGITGIGIFHGVPMTIKESHPTPGIKTTSCDPSSPDLPSWTKCEAAKILIEEGGAILLGKTNQPINACDWEVNNPIFGRTGNPYCPNRSPGGSSGGSAAALAAGFTPIELGSDIGGSIRIPSVMCGVVGHCATRGVIPAMNIELGWSCIDRILARYLEPIIWMGRSGPMARNVELHCLNCWLGTTRRNPDN